MSRAGLHDASYCTSKTQREVTERSEKIEDHHGAKDKREARQKAEVPEVTSSASQ